MHEFIHSLLMFIHSQNSTDTERTVTESDKAGLEPPAPSCGSVGKLLNLSVSWSEKMGMVLLLGLSRGLNEVVCGAPGTSVSSGWSV